MFRSSQSSASLLFSAYPSSKYETPISQPPSDRYSSQTACRRRYQNENDSTADNLMIRSRDVVFMPFTFCHKDLRTKIIINLERCCFHQARLSPTYPSSIKFTTIQYPEDSFPIVALSSSSSTLLPLPDSPTLVIFATVPKPFSTCVSRT